MRTGLPVFFVLLMVFPVLVRAQPSFQSYALGERLPQSVLVNPAFVPSASKALGIPGLSLISLSGGNNGASFAQFFTRQGDSLQLQPSVIDRLWQRNRLEYSAEHNLFFSDIPISTKTTSASLFRKKATGWPPTPTIWRWSALEETQAWTTARWMWPYWVPS